MPVSFLFCSFIWIFSFSILYGQFFEDFSNDLTGWKGDVQHFIINNNQQLQLNAPGAGRSYIYRPSTFPEAFATTAYVRLNFPPSDNNRLRWYFYSSHEDIQMAEGYFIQIGENGPNDAISFFRFRPGQEQELARGTMAAVAESPNVRILVEKDTNDFWVIKTDYTGERLLAPEIEFYENDITIQPQGHFGFLTEYTATRTTGFFIDDVGIDIKREDITPPSIYEAFLSGTDEITIIFDELIEESTATNVQNYILEQPAIRPVEASVVRNVVKLRFNTLFESGFFYKLAVMNIEDLTGNAMGNEIIENLYLAVPPSKGDIILNEILFNPKTGEEDFIELYNKSEKFINIQGLVIFNSQNNRSQTVNQRFDLFPNEYVAIAIRAEEVRHSYQAPEQANIIQNPLPAFNNNDGNVTLLMGENIIDEFDYEENFHSPIINNPKGVSLERINTVLPTNDRNNWTSAASSVNFASPGYRNSAAIEFSEEVRDFSLRYKTFMPNGDGDRDVLIIDYHLDKSNYVAKVTIFSDMGTPVKRLTNNFTLSTSGFLQWDGTNDQGQIARMGIYIVVIEIFHPDGNTAIRKLPAVLAREI
ncbi:MAG TPA: lamin tail domain-containing protein [Saprospiraceae bacterium]|nr:lamin tail domain-containing protein [Saprospiraceae bacterium]